MMLYKFTSEAEIAEKISIGIFRFYELAKYIQMEDDVGRSDPAECSVTFPEEEFTRFPEKIPIASFNGVELRCISIQPNIEYMKQYFVFCMSTVINDGVMSDSKYVVELNADIFETFEMLLCPAENKQLNAGGYKFFSHASVAYYDIHSHPKPLLEERWREAYIKHAIFSRQHEYRAALFASDFFFNRVCTKPMIIRRNIFIDGKQSGFNLKLIVQSGVDSDGWRYIELDISEFAAKLCPEPMKIQEL